MKPSSRQPEYARSKHHQDRWFWDRSSRPRPWIIVDDANPMNEQDVALKGAKIHARLNVAQRRRFHQGNCVFLKTVRDSPRVISLSANVAADISHWLISSLESVPTRKPTGVMLRSSGLSPTNVESPSPTSQTVNWTNRADSALNWPQVAWRKSNSR